MDKNNSSNQLAEELEATIQKNEKFLSDTDKQILKLDKKYAETILEEEKKYLQLAKKITKQEE